VDLARITEALAAAPAFQHLEPELLERVAWLCTPRSFSSGETVFLQGEACRGFYLVVSGRVRLYRLSGDGREQLVHLIGPGRSFAEAALFRIGRYPVNASAAESPTELVEVGGKGFLELFRSEPRLAGAMVGSLSQHLLELVQRVDDLTAVHAETRLARHLLSLPPVEGEAAVTVRLASARKDLAALLGVAPETLSRLLRAWRERGLVETEGRDVRLLDLPALEAVAEGTDRGPA
jgi:CRP/FNR family transcriptional regulator